ncbi:restriction endonuclease subunit S, partial [Mycoplasmoides pneumoniae]|uniref:restriction endonuclease subunit S n=1 Tax=Mycoplasmoides pneumoniae TaxID=2104 RepID=UPI0006BA39C0
MLIKRFKIKDICDIKRGRVISKLYIKNNPGEFPVYSSATVNNGEIGKIKDCDFNGEYVTWTTDGAQAGSVFYRNGQFNATNVCGILKVKSDEINPKFLAYALRLETPKFVNYACPIPKLMQGILAEIELDFPPLQIQEKIATILDTFTELSAELRERKKQYAFYRDYLLNQENIRKIYGANIPFETFQVKDICEIRRGRAITKAYIRNNPGENPVYSAATTNDGELGHIKDCDFDGEYITWTTNGYAGVVFYRNGKFNASQDCGVLKVKNKKICTKFLSFLLKIEAPKFVHNLASRPKLSQKVMAEIELSFPPLEIQEKIADILFAFEKLCNDLVEGIPA